MDPKAAKATLRKAISERLARLTEKERQAESRSVCRRIEQSLPPPPVTITAFYSVKEEVDVRPLLTSLIEKGYEIYLPRYEGGKMVFRRTQNLTELTPGAFGIPEPPITAPLLDPAALAIAIVPARAYNRKGHRLGRGNGGFDIWIRAQRQANPATKFWGICFENQVVDEIPMEAHDETVDAIVTSRGLVPSQR
jgi:5-formyltetrahydrofolate cyclo-ligase